jgi:hypothetical protein
MAYRIIEHHSQSTGHFYRLEMNLCGQFLQELMLPHAAQLQNVSNFVGSLDNENKLIRLPTETDEYKLISDFGDF